MSAKRTGCEFSAKQIPLYLTKFHSKWMHCLVANTSKRASTVSLLYDHFKNSCTKFLSVWHDSKTPTAFISIRSLSSQRIAKSIARPLIVIKWGTLNTEAGLPVVMLAKQTNHWIHLEVINIAKLLKEMYSALDVTKLWTFVGCFPQTRNTLAHCVWKVYPAKYAPKEIVVYYHQLQLSPLSVTDYHAATLCGFDVWHVFVYSFVIFAVVTKFSALPTLHSHRTRFTQAL